MAAPTASRDRITRIHVTGFRSLADVTLDLDGLTVLIGDNGSGKSSLIEVFEVLRHVTMRGGSLLDVRNNHPYLLRQGTDRGELALDIENPTGHRPSLRYVLTLEGERGDLFVESESLEYSHDGSRKPAFRRSKGVGEFLDSSGKSLGQLPLDSRLTMLSYFGHLPSPANLPAEQVAVRRAYAVLSSFEVHVPFETMPTWASRRMDRKSAMRESNMLQSVTQLDLLATNLANAFHSLRNDQEPDHWKETLEYVRLGLGDDVTDIPASVDAGGGQQAISVRFKSAGTVPSVALSDGTLSYLAFVAMLRLPSSRSLLAFDEPELHLHPGLLVRVLSMFETIAESCPVVLATHSDRLLDALQDPAKSVVLCDLDDKRAARLLRPDKAMLTKWLTKYRGLGDIRSTGLQDAVIPRTKADR